MNATIKTLVRFAAAVALSAVTILPHTGVSHAAGPRPLMASDFYGLTHDAQYLPTDSTHVPTIAGTQYARGLVPGRGCCFQIGEVAGSATFNLARYPGYNVFSAEVGVSDDSDPNTTAQLNITGDGKVLYSHVFSQGQLAVKIVVPLGKAQAISLLAIETSTNTGMNMGILLAANPVLLPSGAQPAPTNPSPASSAPSTGKGALQFFSSAVAPGGQQVALVTTAANASVVLVIDYPNGSQAVLGPKQAGPDGHLAITWAVPSGIHGAVHVTVDSAGKVAQGSFTVS